MTYQDKYFQRLAQEFDAQTADHTLTVLHDDGEYRHLRMRGPQGSWWSWDVICWPGHVATVGDIADGYTFCRPLEFFADPYGPNPHYWLEKLLSGHGIRHVDRDQFLAFVDQTLDEGIEGVDVDDLWFQADSCHEPEDILSFLNSNAPFNDDPDWDVYVLDTHAVHTCLALYATARAYFGEDS